MLVAAPLQWSTIWRRGFAAGWPLQRHLPDKCRIVRDFLALSRMKLAIHLSVIYRHVKKIFDTSSIMSKDGLIMTFVKVGV